MRARSVPATLAALALAGSSTQAFTISLSDSDFTNIPMFSGVTTYSFEIDLGPGLHTGLYADPAMNNVQYSVSGSLDITPSGFSGFGFQLDHIFPLSPPITGAEFYALNPSSTLGETLRFIVSPTANLADGLQVSELLELGGSFGPGVVFHLNAREEGTGRYHPAFLQLRSDGTGIIQNANNMGGINPSTMQVVDVDFGEEYITNLTFDPAALTLGIPEPGTATFLFAGSLLLGLRRRAA